MEQTGTIEKALDVLYFLHAQRRARGVSEIARSLGLPKSSAHRLLSSLGSRGMVERDDRGHYRPGVALVALGLGVLASEPIVAAARPVLEAESEATGETAFLTVARNGRIVVLDKVEGGGLLRVAPQIGAEVPVHATAVGKLYLAFAPQAVILPTEPWEAFTARTPGTASELERGIALARRLGWAENREEWIPGLAVIAAPVLLGHRMVGCFVLAAPASRFPQSAIDSLARRAVSAAAEISSRLEIQEGRAT